MIDSGLTDEDLKLRPTKTGVQFEKAKDEKTRDIWNIIEPNYKGEFKGYMYYSTIYRLVDRANTGDYILKRFKPFRKFQMKNGGSIGSNHKSIGYSSLLGISTKIKGHDMIAECAECGDEFSYQKSKSNLLWECPRCNSKKPIH